MKKLEFLIVTILMFYTLQYSDHALNRSCLSLYTYSNQELIDILNKPNQENLWLIVNKLEIIDECKYKDYSEFLKIASKSNLEVDFRGYEFLSKGIANVGTIAKEKMTELGIK